MIGRFLIGPHALERWRARVRRGGTLDQLLAESERWYRVKDGREPNTGAWRHTPEPRYRIVVDEKGWPLKVITILGVFDR